MIIRVFLVIFRAFCTMSILVAAKHTANAVMHRIAKCKVTQANMFRFVGAKVKVRVIMFLVGCGLVFSYAG